VSRLQRDRHGASETIGAPRRENLRHVQGMQRQGTYLPLRALRRRSQLAPQPARSLAGFHRVVPLGDNLVDIAACLALKGADVEAQMAGRDACQLRYCFADRT
jgi:hypothetical protein